MRVRSASDCEGLSLSYSGPIAEVRLNRPAKRNAINRAMWRGLQGALGEAAARRDTRVVIVRGAGGNFAAGADIAEFDEVFADDVSASNYLDDMIAATAAISALLLPTIAVIEGLCIGAGVAVALACDLRFAAGDARFAVTPAKLGLVYSLTDTIRLVDAVGASAARDLLFSGRAIDAATAMRIGLVDDVFEPAEVESRAREYALTVSEVSATSIASAKRILGMIQDGQREETTESRDLFVRAPRGPDFAEGLAAFRARRPTGFPAR